MSQSHYRLPFTAEVQEAKQKMAGKLLKHLGFGAKKAPPQPPKPDYTAIKLTSSESALSKSPTSERPGTSHIGEFELAQLPHSPHRLPSEKTNFGGARPKDSGGGISPKSAPGDRASVSIDEPETPGPEKESQKGGGSGQGASATPPRLLDEYSDPADLKKDLPEELLGACANPLVEDDYSVPYEVKSMFRDLQLRGADGGPDGGDSPNSARVKGPRLYDDPYEEPVAGGAPPGPRPFPPPEATDKRPKEDYDEPWEWSAKPSLLLHFESAGVNAIPPHFISIPSASQTRTPQLKRTAPGPASSTSSVSKEGPEGESAGTDSGDGGAGSPVDEPDAGGASAEPAGTGSAAAVVSAAPAAAEDGQDAAADVDDTYEATSGYEQTQRTKAEDSDEEGYTHLREEFGPSGPKPPDTDTRRTGNYEEPWDLTSKQKELEDKIKDASDRATRAETKPAKSSGPAPHESDTRSQEGYEKPWDWKPHLKDDRPQEGYEKPWDWKPHQKDDRPTEEYEEPWDQKAKELERDLMLGKGNGSSPDTTSPTTSAAATTAATTATTGATTPPSVKDNKEDDTRPPAEYDEPWDSKKKAPVSRTGSSADSSPKASQGGALSQSLSPKKKSKLNLDLGSRAWNALGERVDPNLPLNQQGWYHGSISRVDAENLLRVHKEGSYLVRMSESNKMDYSLSLKSTRGFMHMKIVSRDNRFILGQFSQPFDTIPQMIHHYSISKLPIKGAEHMSLLHPIMNELL